MDVFGAGDIAERSFLKVSYGQQRLVLLVRAFVKNPDLLILDEPFHGLDAGKKALAGRIVEAYARRSFSYRTMTAKYRRVWTNARFCQNLPEYGLLPPYKSNIDRKPCRSSYFTELPLFSQPFLLFALFLFPTVAIRFGSGRNRPISA